MKNCIQAMDEIQFYREIFIESILIIKLIDFFDRDAFDHLLVFIVK